LDKTKKEKYKINFVLKPLPMGSYIPSGEPLYFISGDKLCMVEKTYSYRCGYAYTKPQVLSGGITTELVEKSSASYESSKMLASAIGDIYDTSREDSKIKTPPDFWFIEKKVSIIT
jgi:hypothetical protein